MDVDVSYLSNLSTFGALYYLIPLVSVQCKNLVANVASLDRHTSVLHEQK